MFHYEKLCPVKPHYLTTKIQKTTHIQLLCNYPLNITTITQLLICTHCTYICSQPCLIYFLNGL